MSGLKYRLKLERVRYRVKIERGGAQDHIFMTVSDGTHQITCRFPHQNQKISTLQDFRFVKFYLKHVLGNFCPSKHLTFDDYLAELRWIDIQPIDPGLDEFGFYTEPSPRDAMYSYTARYTYRAK